MKSLAKQASEIQNRIHDAPMATEFMLDDAAVALESFAHPYRNFLTSSSAKITVNGNACPS